MESNAEAGFVPAATYVWADLDDLFGGRCDRAVPVVVVDGRQCAGGGDCRCRLTGSIAPGAATAEMVREREVWLMISSPLDLWMADVLTELGADVVVLRNDPAAARELGFTEPR